MKCPDLPDWFHTFLQVRPGSDVGVVNMLFVNLWMKLNQFVLIERLINMQCDVKYCICKRLQVSYSNIKLSVLRVSLRRQGKQRKARVKNLLVIFAITIKTKVSQPFTKMILLLLPVGLISFHGFYVILAI